MTPEITKLHAAYHAAWFEHTLAMDAAKAAESRKQASGAAVDMALNVLRSAIDTWIYNEPAPEPVKATIAVRGDDGVVERVVPSFGYIDPMPFPVASTTKCRIVPGPLLATAVDLERGIQAGRQSDAFLAQPVATAREIIADQMREGTHPTSRDNFVPLEQAGDVAAPVAKWRKPDRLNATETDEVITVRVRAVNEAGWPIVAGEFAGELGCGPVTC
jgi:hypothetical protein